MICIFRWTAWLPFPVLERLGKALYWFLYKVVGYRKSVVLLNLNHAFPDWRNQTFYQTERRYYRYLSELILEVIKGFYMPLNQLLKRVSVDKDAQILISEMYSRHQQVVLMLGHYGNWEWPLLMIQKYTKYKPFALYMPLSNPYLDRYFKRKRQRFGATMLSVSEPRQIYAKLKDQPSILALVGDQSPTGRNRALPVSFLSMQTNFFLGGEKLAKRLDAAVLYVQMQRKGLGQYRISLKVITETPLQEAKGEITRKYASLLESDIKNKPEYWIWSHKRWKGQINY